MLVVSSVTKLWLVVPEKSVIGTATHWPLMNWKVTMLANVCRKNVVATGVTFVCRTRNKLPAGAQGGGFVRTAVMFVVQTMLKKFVLDATCRPGNKPCNVAASLVSD